MGVHHCISRSRKFLTGLQSCCFGGWSIFGRISASLHQIVVGDLARGQEDTRYTRPCALHSESEHRIKLFLATLVVYVAYTRPEIIVTVAIQSPCLSSMIHMIEDMYPLRRKSSKSGRRKSLHSCTERLCSASINVQVNYTLFDSQEIARPAFPAG